MASGSDMPAEHTSHARYLSWLPPFLAFAGLAILIALARDPWVYSLPYGKDNPQVLWIKTGSLRGEADFPRTAHLGGRLAVTGWLAGVEPSGQPQNIALYLDNKPIAETSVFRPAAMKVNGQSIPIQVWQLDLYYLKEALPGEHIFALQLVPQNHEPITLAQTSVVVLR
jgi:hypothetical protein